LDLLVRFCREHPDRAELPFLLLSSKQARQLRTAMAQRQIRAALDKEECSEAGRLLAEARRNQLRISIDFTEWDSETFRQYGIESLEPTGAPVCDTLILVLCAPKQRRNTRQWGSRFLKLAENAVGKGNFDLASRCVEFVMGLSIIERDLLPGLTKLATDVPQLRSMIWQKAMTYAKQAEDWALDPNMPEDAPLDRTFEILGHVLDVAAAVADPEKPSLESRENVASLIKELYALVVAVETSPSEKVRDRAPSLREFLESSKALQRLSQW
jgi:hypothetical protein